MYHSTAQKRRLINALGAVTGEGEIVEPITDNEVIVKVVTRITIGVALIMLTAIGGCTYYEHREQESERIAIANGMLPAADINGRVWIRPECAASIPAVPK